jgi:hypothetical protein
MIIGNESPKEDKEDLTIALEEGSKDPIEFIDRFLFTFDPKREPYKLPFVLFDYQEELVRVLVDSITTGNDLFVEKCREMGVTYVTLAVFFWFWRYVPGSNFLLGSRKEQYVDNKGGSNEGEVKNKEESLFGKLEYFIDNILPTVLPIGFNKKKNLTYMSLVNPENGNVISGESSNPSFSRGGRHKAVLLDEFAFWDNDNAAWGATADTTNCRIVLTTPGIRPCKAKRLRFGKDGEEIKLITLPYTLDPRKTPEWLERERKRRSQEDFAREIMINWEVSIKGKVYPEIENAQFGQFPYNPDWPLYVSWDFGLDGMALQWWQKNMVNGKKRLVEAYENNNEAIPFYFPFIGKDIDSTYNYSETDLNTIRTVKNYKKAIHYGDPDVSKRSLLTGTSTRQALQAQKIYVQTNPEANDFISRREKTKVMLQEGIEINQTPGTDYYLECMRNARYPQRDEQSQATSPVTLPIHDWTSHHRTSTEYFAVNYKGVPEQQRAVENDIDEIDPY